LARYIQLLNADAPQTWTVEFFLKINHYLGNFSLKKELKNPLQGTHHKVNIKSNYARARYRAPGLESKSEGFLKRDGLLPGFHPETCTLTILVQ